MSLHVDIEKTLGAFHLRVKLQAEDETLALLGASGCGKSMTLKCIAGIQRPDRGRIVVDDVVLFDSEKKIDLSPQQRRTGLLFQNYALFPNMTVVQNIRCGTRREPDREKRRRETEEILKRFGLWELRNHYPHQLSGGQQQRTTLARILVSDPRILLLDEPFSALDSHLRFQLERHVREVIRQFGKTVVLVSHDRDEVFRMTNSIAIMEEGVIRTQGGIQQVFAQPKTISGAMLTGCKNVTAAQPLDGDSVRALDWGITLKTPGAAGAKALGIRMHDVCPGEGENSCLCQVVEEIENPFSYTIMLRPKEGQAPGLLGMELSKERWNALRQPELTIHLPPESLLILDE